MSDRDDIERLLRPLTWQEQALAAAGLPIDGSGGPEWARPAGELVDEDELVTGWSEGMDVGDDWGGHPSLREHWARCEDAPCCGCCD